MSRPPESRYRELRALEVRARRWAVRRPEVAAIALVGSFARGAPGPDSDIDLMLLVDEPEELATDTDWLDVLAPGAVYIRTGRWGPVTEHRVRAPTDTVLEFGVASPSWARLPLDPGTARVLGDGARLIHDPRGLLGIAIAHARRP